MQIFLQGKGEATSEVKFYMAPNNSLVVDSLSVKATAVVLSAEGRSINYTLELPTIMSLKLSSPVREARFKITLTTNKPAVSVASLFEGKCSKRILNTSELRINLVVRF